MDTVALLNHEQSLLLARTKSGTLKLVNSERGLHYEFDAPNTSTGNDLLELLERGDIYGSSFAFRVKKDQWEIVKENGQEREKRTILEFSDLIDVSPVVFPAYVNTDVAKRSRDEQLKPAEPEGIDWETEQRIYKTKITKPAKG
jgi:HK97 family phage prohead protease